MKSSFLVAFLSIGLSVSAQLQFHSIQEVFRYADLHAVAIKSALIGEQLAASEVKESKLNLLPTFNGALGFNDNITLQPTLVPGQLTNPAAEEGTFEELVFGTKYQYTRSLSLQWDVLNVQKFLSVQTAKVQSAGRRAETELHRFNTYNQLASTYYSVLLMQESIDLYTENVSTAAAIQSVTAEKFAEGLISTSELNRAEMSVLQSQRNLDLVKSNLVQLTIQLQGQLNTNQAIQVSDSLANFELAQTTIDQVHPEIIRQQLLLENYQSLVKQQKAERLPSVSLVYQNNATWASNELLDFSGANRLPQQLFGVKLDFSGLLRPAAKQRVSQSELQLEGQQLQLENTRLLQAQEDELLQLQLQQAAGQLESIEKVLSLQRQNDQHAENRYQEGVFSLDQRLNEYDELLSVQNSYLESLATYTLAKYKIYIRQLDFRSTTTN